MNIYWFLFYFIIDSCDQFSSDPIVKVFLDHGVVLAKSVFFFIAVKEHVDAHLNLVEHARITLGGRSLVGATVDLVIVLFGLLLGLEALCSFLLLLLLGLYIFIV
jgi:hypothetical protein